MADTQHTLPQRGAGERRALRPVAVTLSDSDSSSMSTRRVASEM